MSSATDSLTPEERQVTQDAAEPPVRPAAPWARLAVCAGIFALGLVVLTQGLAVRGTLDPSGPKLFPVLIGILWLVLGALHLMNVLRDLRGGEGTESVQHGMRLLLLVAVLIAYTYLIYPLGYVLSTTLLFFFSAWVLGSSRRVLNLVVAVVLTVAVYLTFTRLLGISLPQGVIPL